MRPSDDPTWDEINPAWRVFPYTDYEVLGNIEIVREKPPYSPPSWRLRAALRKRGEVRITYLEEEYPDPFLAADAKAQIEAHAWRIFWDYNLVRAGDYYE